MVGLERLGSGALSQEGVSLSLLYRIIASSGKHILIIEQNFVVGLA